MTASIELDLNSLAPHLEQMGVEFEQINWQRTHAKLALVLESETKRNFDRGESPDGVPWAPLKQPRGRSKGQDLPLRDTGLLMASYSAQGQHHVQSSDGDTLRWGSNLDYAAYHQFGVEGPNGVFIPARPHVGINEETAELIDLIILEESEMALMGQ